MAELPVVNIHIPFGPDISLSLDEFWLALLGLVDFEGDWEALLTASGLVTDGAAKANLITNRLLPVSDHLPVLLQRGVDAFELLTARHWFRHRSCQPVAGMPSPRPKQDDRINHGAIARDEATP
jgi:hypothetical protein